MHSGTIGQRKCRAGFTMMELVIVVLVMSLLTGLALPRVTSALRQREADQVRDDAMMMAFRARSLALEKSRTIKFELDTSAGVAKILDGTTEIAVNRFATTTGARAQSNPALISMCYSVRGFAVEPCSTNVGTGVQVVFSRGGYSAAMRIWQLGQVTKS